ncbi:hypothetical protein B0H13DRAFT_2520611 [Mycena leptocephala]|nr:hypothetical protein B0H13DRAFT_2520611 [Mycena leptocephala]
MARQRIDGRTIYRSRCTVKESLKTGSTAGDVELKGRIGMTFIDASGAEEAGDGGGVFREFFMSLCKEVFDTDWGLLANKKNVLILVPILVTHKLMPLHRVYRWQGDVRGILVDSAGYGRGDFWTTSSCTTGLSSLSTAPETRRTMNFTVAVEGVQISVSPLMPNGSDVAVNKENRLQYIYLISHYRLGKQSKMQSVLRGLSEIIDPSVSKRTSRTSDMDLQQELAEWQRLFLVVGD